MVQKYPRKVKPLCQGARLLQTDIPVYDGPGFVREPNANCTHPLIIVSLSASDYGDFTRIMALYKLYGIYVLI